MNEKFAMFSTPPPFALSLARGKRGVFQHPVRLKPKNIRKVSLVATQTPFSRQLETWAAALSSGRFLFQERGMQLNSFYDSDFT